MASLINTKISNTYAGLIKTLDNAVISETLRQLSDGEGNNTGLFINTLGDFKVTKDLTVDSAIYMLSPDGSKWKITIDNNGAFEIVAAV
tara:strand:+ start:2598 stop:2864 length:267 start_codon:yes stop_codon:yes gene_type:complete